MTTISEKEIISTPAEVVRAWNDYAPHYWSFANLRWLYDGFRKKMKKALIPCNGGIVLDGGCGSGSNFKTIIDAQRPRLLVGVDLSPAMLREAEKMKTNLNGRRGCEIKLINADFCQKLPLPSNYFDAQLYHLVLYYLPYGGWRKSIAEEAFRIAKPGGYVVTTDFLKGYDFRKTVGSGWRPILLGFMELFYGRFLTYLHFMRNVRPVLLRIQELEEGGVLRFPTEEELTAAFEQAGFIKIEIISRLIGGGMVLRAFKPR